MCCSQTQRNCPSPLQKSVRIKALPPLLQVYAVTIFPDSDTRGKPQCEGILSVRLLEASLLPFRMDLVPAPSGKDPSLKPPVVEVEAVDMVSAEVQGTVNAEKPVGLGEESSPSESETDNDGSGDEWESESLYEGAIQFVRDEQLRDRGTLYWPQFFPFRTLADYLSGPRCLHLG